MFRNAANPVIRLVFFPILLLFYLHHIGDAMPNLAPIFVVLFLTLMPTKPPLNMLLKLLLVLLFISFVLVFLGDVLKDTPLGYSLFCWSLLFWSYYRSHRDPKDLISTLVLMVVIIITVMNFQMNAPMNILPWLMFKAFLIAIVVTYISFLLFPGDEKDILPDEVSNSGAEEHIGLIVFKASAMCIVLVVLMGIGSSQTILIAITISNIIKIPMPEDHRAFSLKKIITTALGVLFTIPIMFLFTFGISTWALIGVTLFCGLQLACFSIARQCRMSIYQLLFVNFVVLTYHIIKLDGVYTLSAEFTRLLSVIIAVIVGAVIMNLVKYTPIVLAPKESN